MFGLEMGFERFDIYLHYREGLIVSLIVALCRLVLLFPKVGHLWLQGLVDCSAAYGRERNPSHCCRDHSYKVCL